jgi:hypothetical protein
MEMRWNKLLPYVLLGVLVAGVVWKLGEISTDAQISFLFFSAAAALMAVLSRKLGQALLGLVMMIVPLPIAIAKYPVAYTFACRRIVAQPQLADCHVKLKHLSGWGDYRLDYREIAKAKIIPVNAISSAEPGGKRKRSKPITVQHHPVFLTNRLSRSQKVEDFDYRQATSTPVVERINQFLASDQSAFTINLLNEPQISKNGMSQRDYVLLALFQILMFGGLGLAILLKNVAIYLNSLLPKSDQNKRLIN